MTVADGAGGGAAGRGMALGLLAVLIWAGYFVASRAAVLGGLSPADLTALRFGVAGLLLLPLAWRHRGALTPVQIAVLMCGAGAPYMLISVIGLAYAPAAHGAVLQPGTIPLFSALLATLWLGEPFGRRRVAGLGLSALGVAMVGAGGLAVAAPGAWKGHLLFLLGGFCWALYTVAARAWRVDPWAATALVSVWSAILYLPVYLLVFESGLAAAPPTALLFHGLYQGVLTGIVALAAWSTAVGLAGAGRVAALTALVPCLGAVLAVPILDERLGPVEIVGLAIVSLGLFLAVIRPAARR